MKFLRYKVTPALRRYASETLGLTLHPEAHTLLMNMTLASRFRPIGSCELDDGTRPHAKRKSRPSK